MSRDECLFDIFKFRISSFAVAVLLDDRQFPAALASTKREASLQAAYKTLYQLSLDARQSQVKFICILPEKNKISFSVCRDLI